jgi:TetR/AcrR family transcriptional regulator
MSEPEHRRGRVHDAEGAREAILNAAEEVFAEHGFDGARIDAIAAASGYNKSLIFQYFGDKLGLYAAVVRRAERQMNTIQTQLLASLLEDDIASDAHKFKMFLKTITSAFFDYLVEHPRFMRIFTWEMAEGWQTFAKIISEHDREDIEQFRPLLYKAQRAGLLRPGFDPAIQLTMGVYFCQYYLAFLPLYQILLPDEDVSSAAALTRAREHIVEFVVHGMMVDLPETTSER